MIYLQYCESIAEWYDDRSGTQRDCCSVVRLSGQRASVSEECAVCRALYCAGQIDIIMYGNKGTVETEFDFLCLASLFPFTKEKKRINPACNVTGVVE